MASYSACFESKYSYSDGWRIPTSRASACSDTPAIPCSRASFHADSTIEATLASRRATTLPGFN